MKPQPRVVKEICSLCGLDWHRHGEKPTAEKCVELLRRDLASANAALAARPFPYLQPLPWIQIPYVPSIPYLPPSRPYYGTITAVGSSSQAAQATPTPRYQTVCASNVSPHAITQGGLS